MESNKNIFGEYGERFWDDVVGTSSNFPEPSANVEVSSSAVVEDILQQSLRQAKILDTNEESDPLDFDNFGFTYNNCSNNSNVYNDYSQVFNSNNGSEIPASSLGSIKSVTLRNDNHSSFDVSEFLNITTAATKASTTVVVKNSVPSFSVTNVTFTSYPNTVIHHQTNCTASISNTVSGSLTLPLTTAPANSAFVLHLSQSNQVINKSLQSLSNFIVTHQNTPYVISAVQTKSSTANASVSNTVRLPVSLQNSIPVCNSTFTKSVSQPVSTPVVFSVKTLNNQNLAALGSVQMQPVRNHVSAATQQKQATQNLDDQTTKLALILQSRATNYPGVGKVLKVGSQNINISDIGAAKMLASKILQQKRNQQSQITVLTPSSSLVNTSQNVAVINIPVSGLKNTTAVSLPQQLHSPVPNSNLSHTQVAVRAPARSTHAAFSPSTSSSISAIGKPVPVVKRENTTPSPQGRFQIASVNISRISNLPGTSSQQRINSPLAIVSNPQLVNAVKVIPIQSPLHAATSSGPSTVIQYQGATIKLNLPAQQASCLTNEQLQKVLQQHQATATPGKTAVQSQTNGAALQIQTKPLITSAHGVHVDKITKVMTFRVDPNLTSQQIDEVQQIILQKVPLNKSQQQLTNEQKQLLSVFRAQLRSVEPAMQQYYLKNPHLFLQKVHQHIQTGKPFVFQVKVDSLNTSKATTAPTTSVTSKPNLYGGLHPTITLSADGAHKTSAPRGPLSVMSTQPPGLRAQAPVVSVAALSRSAPIPIKSSSTPVLHVPKPVRHLPMRTAPPVTTTVASRKSKRSANVIPDNSALPALPAKRPSLILEQLQKHRELAATPNIGEPFKNTRDAYRKLLPFHVFNTPQIKEESFHDAESMFDRVSEGATSKINKMLKKYQLLCLKDAAMEVCSADLVMLDRVFLQREKTALADVKRDVKDNPDSLVSYLPPSYANEYPHLAAHFEAQIQAKQQASDPAGDLRQSSTSPRIFQPDPPEHFATQEVEEDLLLQEAVESILT